MRRMIKMKDENKNMVLEKILLSFMNTLLLAAYLFIDYKLTKRQRQNYILLKKYHFCLPEQLKVKEFFAVAITLL